MWTNIRKAKPNEFDKIIHLFDDMDPGIIEEVKEAYRKKFKDIEQEKRIILFAEDDMGRVIGSVQLELTHKNPEMADGKTISHVDALRVMPEHRNQGIGKKLMDEAEQIAKDRGFKKITLGFKKGETHEFLKKFYINLGYQFLKEKEDGTTTIFRKSLY